jgi:phage gp29-like protein
VASLLEAGERGDYADLQWLYRMVEKRDATLRGGKRKLLSGLEEMDWNIRTCPEDLLPWGCTPEDVEAQEIALRAAYDGVANLREAFSFLALADFRGFSHLEKVELDGQVVRLECVPQWHWSRKGIYGEWYYDAASNNRKDEAKRLDKARFIVREVEDPINEIALIGFVRKNMGQKDWAGFVESYGIPSLFAIMPPNVKQGEEAQFLELAERTIGDSRGVLPSGSDIKTVGDTVRGVQPFEAFIRHQDEQTVMAITSGMLTMLAESGSGTLAGGAHYETFQSVVRALARRIGETMQQQFDAPFLAKTFPGQPPLAWFELAAEEEVDAGQFVTAVQQLAAAGLDVDEEQVEEKTGYRVTRREASMQPPGTSCLRMGNRAPSPAPLSPMDEANTGFEAALQRLGDAQFADNKALSRRLQALMDGPDGQLETGLQTLLAELPQLASGDDAQSVAAWTELLRAAVAHGFEADQTALEGATDHEV